MTDATKGLLTDEGMATALTGIRNGDFKMRREAGDAPKEAAVQQSQLFVQASPSSR